MAGELDVDLSRSRLRPIPGVRLMDYGKFKYQEQKRAAEAKSKQKVIEVKEVEVPPRYRRRRLPIRCATCAAFHQETATKAR